MGITMSSTDMQIAFNELDDDAGGTVEIEEFMDHYRSFLRARKDSQRSGVEVDAVEASCVSQPTTGA